MNQKNLMMMMRRISVQRSVKRTGRVRMMTNMMQMKIMSVRLL